MGETTPARDIAVGFIRAELETRAGSATVAVSDATGGDASGRDLCGAFVREGNPSLFSTTIA